MVDFDIKHYLNEDASFEYDPDRFEGVFYGEFENKPETEQELLTLQAEYLKTRDQAIWQKMFGICWSYMKSLILQRIQKKAEGYKDPEIVDDRTTSATLAFMSQYLTRPDFEVGTSFAGMMKWKIVEVLYKDKNPKKKGGEPISLSLEISDDGKATLEDLIAAEGPVYSPEDAICQRNSYEIIDEILKELDDTLDCENREYIRNIVRLYIVLCMRHPKNRHAKKMFLDKWAKNYKIEKLIDYVMLEIRNRLYEG